MNQVKDIATVHTGVYLKERPDGEVQYLQVKDFDKSTHSFFSFPSVNMANKIKKYLLSEGDLLFAAKGFVNFCVVYREAWGAAVASSSFLVLKIKDKDKIMPEYLNWHINRDDMNLRFKNMTAGNVMPSVTKTMMENMEIPVPSLSMQKKIIALTTLCDREGALLEQIRAKRRELMQKEIIHLINKQ